MKGPPTRIWTSACGAVKVSGLNQRFTGSPEPQALNSNARGPEMRGKCEAAEVAWRLRPASQSLQSPTPPMIFWTLQSFLVSSNRGDEEPRGDDAQNLPNTRPEYDRQGWRLRLEGVR